MGWFWTDPSPAPSAALQTPPHPLPRGNVEPPPACPMHQSSTSATTPISRPSTAQPACPYQPPPTSTTIEPQTSPSYVSKLNPLNYMPSNLSNTRDTANTAQTINLPLTRETSTIPRGDGEGTWEYPSPQQMYNAMLRKGYTDTPAEHVEAMVAVHNFLNEGAWEEIREWERRFAGGLARGWSLSAKGEEGARQEVEREEMLRRRRRGAGEDAAEPKLLRFVGRPNDLTPKARVMSVLAYLNPSTFAKNPPFDRHDWYIQRSGSVSPGAVSGAGKERRYVIDYYSGPPEPTGEPVFYLDVRPAVDGPVAACERVIRWGGDVWWRATGGSVREEMARREQRGQRS